MLMPAFFRPKAPYFGTQLVNSSVNLGTLGGATIVDTATTSLMIPKPVCTTCQLIGLNMNAMVAGVVTGTGTIQVFKRDNSGTPADRTLTATKSIESDVVTVADTTYTIAITSTSIQNLTFKASDACRIDVVCSGAVGTQPQITVNAMWAIVQP